MLLAKDKNGNIVMEGSLIKIVDTSHESTGTCFNVHKVINESRVKISRVKSTGPTSGITDLFKLNSDQFELVER
ncbi:hypothetical protein COT68_02565 [bacterium (Candidatus Torokbacteria) CG09_land_8_20_14_0_10_42_11]|nr:MAG: hypothetical protein COT68_02565 [bacterium (Candidatus Torokbacteria) CG09_land_8_20_14_0_10_42_11]